MQGRVLRSPGRHQQNRTDIHSMQPASTLLCSAVLTPWIPPGVPKGTGAPGQTPRSDASAPTGQSRGLNTWGTLKG